MPPVREFRNSLFRRDGRSDRSKRGTTSTKSTSSTLAPSSSDVDAWSSTDAQFTSLRFYVWTGGNPGFTLTTTSHECSDDDLSLSDDQQVQLRVATVSARGVWRAGVRPGDVLETAGGMRVDTTDVEAALVLVQMSTSPSIVRFRSATSGRRVRFDVLLDGDKLGVFFTGDGEHDVPVVTRLTPRQQRLGFRSGHEDAESIAGVRLGDVLVAVNGMDAIAAGLSRVTAYVDTCPRPLRLTFERAANDDEEDLRAALRRHQTASECSGEQRGRAPAIRSAILPGLAASGAKAGASARLRCRAFLRSFLPVGGLTSTSAQSHRTVQASNGWQTTADAGLEVAIEWTEGPLGLTLLEDAISGTTLVNRLTGKGRSLGMERLQHGFQLYSINGERTEGRALRQLHRDLVTLPKPVLLLFRPPRCDDSSDGDHESMYSASSLSPSASSARMDAGAQQEATLRATVLQQCYPERLASSHTRSEYQVLWDSRRLGLELEFPEPKDAKKTSKKSSTGGRKRHPIIHGVLKSCTLELTAANVGDALVSVNNWRTTGLNSSELLALLESATKPAVLCFRRRQDASAVHVVSPPSDSPCASDGEDAGEVRSGATYSILWVKAKGELGLTFGCYHDTDRRNALVAYVKRVGAGQARETRLVAVGDLLVRINGQRLPQTKKKAEKTMRALQKSSEPVALGFRRLLVERSGDWSNSQPDP